MVFGPKTEEFEDKFSAYCDSTYGIGVNNCTDALYIALKALDVGDGDVGECRTQACPEWDRPVPL